MRLYVHYEEANLHWTMRLTVDPAVTTLNQAVARFYDLFVIKFSRDLDLSQILVFAEMHQNDSTRRRIAEDKFAQTLQQLGFRLSSDRNPGSDGNKVPCDVELVITTPPTTRDKTDGQTKDNKHPDADPNLRQVLDIALGHMRAQRQRTAREIFETFVLSVEPTHPEALLSVGEIYFSIGKYDTAARKCFKVCWQAHRERPRNKALALMAFASSLKLTECQLRICRYHDALSTLDEVQQFLRHHSKHGGFFSDSTDKKRMEAQTDFLRACALYDLGSPAEQESATSLLAHLLPDLQDSRVNLDALQMYARVAQDRGRCDEALGMLLRVLVGRSNDHSVRKQLVELIRGKSGRERLLRCIPTTTPSAAAPYAFIATILKDFSAFDTAVWCFEQALKLTPTSAAYALNLAHALEVDNRYQDAHDSLVHFFCANRSSHVCGILRAGDVLDLLGSDSWSLEPTCSQTLFDYWTMDWKEQNGEGFAVVRRNGELPIADAKSNPTQISEQELDLLACFFAVVKILFVSGRLHTLPGLVGLLEPLRTGRHLHKTTIRNEHAYYMCIAQLLCVKPTLAIPMFSVANQTMRSNPAGRLSEVPTYVCGDSHTLATAWRRIRVDGSSVQLRPALVTGLKHWHLRKDSDFYPKANFWKVLDSLPRGSRVIFLFGEIDCREGILRAVEQCKYESVQEGMEHTVGIFMSALAEIAETYNFEIFIHPVVPVLNETRHLVIQYNHIFRRRVAESKLGKWLDFFDDLVEGSPPKLRSCYELDGTHLHPSYLSLLERELETHFR